MKIRILGLIALAAGFGVGACDLLTDPPQRLVAILGTIEEPGPGGAELQLAAGSIADCTCDECFNWNGMCVIDFSRNTLYDAPDTVTAGVPFEVGFHTSMPPAPECRRPDGAEISASPGLVEIVPYDVWVGWGCPDGPGYPRRAVELVIAEPGDAVIRISGRVVVIGDSVQTYSELMGMVEHPVVILP